MAENKLTYYMWFCCGFIIKNVNAIKQITFCHS